MKSNFAKLALVGVLFLLASTLRAAETSGPRGTWFLSVDNDLFSDSDDHYTSGVQLGWVSGVLADYGDGPVPASLARPLRALPWVNDEGRQRFISYSVSHRIFTPNDIKDPNLIVNDMPYTGLLFGALTAGAQDERKMDAFSVIVGMAGPAAFGEEVQRAVHAAIGSPRPRGWAHQVRNEPLLNLNYEHRWRLAQFGQRRGWGGDLIGQAALAVGNLLTDATAGVGGRIGWRVPDDYGLPPQFFGEETIGSRPFSRAAGDRGVYLFALVNGSAFANAIFWDGNTFAESHSIDYDHWIARFYSGLRVRWGKWGATFGYAATTVPWNNPANKTSQRYGRVGITYTY